MLVYLTRLVLWRGVGKSTTGMVEHVVKIGPYLCLFLCVSGIPWYCLKFLEDFSRKTAMQAQPSYLEQIPLPSDSLEELGIRKLVRWG